ncbi:hypothetical protein RY831_16350 [Noviherbaspirillum sp. CPCC 100848]|uniref:Secreted protein n=1 Tax=Noviherbaspirillum album TaxID=3080276 RepID=A0ABU6JAS2_9BURK|nr:hypothetical protein [Noviherbaspirillum sp. CPCC 100848]MEC4720736.1 hypothetical protein [Noviherbaspirillum sp. CPCC 100848]
MTTTSSASGANQINQVSSFAGMDLETALMAVQSERANQLEIQLKGQLDAVQNRNANIAKLNGVLGQLNALDGKFPSDAKPTDKIGGKASSTDVSALNTALKDAELGGVFPKGFNTDATKSDIAGAIGNIKSLIDAQGNSQQMDMLRLQSLSNKRNEAFDIMTNFVKKMQDSRSSIIQKMG